LWQAAISIYFFGAPRRTFAKKARDSIYQKRQATKTKKNKSSTSTSTLLIGQTVGQFEVGLLHLANGVPQRKLEMESKQPQHVAQWNKKQKNSTTRCYI